MVEITNGVSKIKVTKGAFDGIYSRLGYRVVEKEKKQEELNTEQNSQSKTKDEFEELKEKPISAWSKDDVKKFALANDIDTSEAKNFGEAKNIVKKWLEENE